MDMAAIQPILMHWYPRQHRPTALLPFTVPCEHSVYFSFIY